MKKAARGLICLLFALTILYPAGIAAAACLGYSFELMSVPAFAALLAALSACTIVLDIIGKNTVKNNVMRVLSAGIAPLSLVNAAFYIFRCPRISVIVSVLFSSCCCFFLTVKYGRPSALKIIALILSALMVLPLGYLSFIASAFGNFGQNTVVKTVESPSGMHYAQVIDSDQGALGGDTVVDVYRHGGVNMLIFRMEKKPQRVYEGDWGEFKNMQIYWKDDNCLIINSVEYEIK